MHMLSSELERKRECFLSTEMELWDILFYFHFLLLLIFFVFYDLFNFHFKLYSFINTVFLSLRVFGLLSSSLLLFPQCFGR